MKKDIEQLVAEWAKWYRGQIGSLGYPQQSIDASHAMGQYEYTISKRQIKAIQSKIRKKETLTKAEQEEIDYYKLYGEPKPKATGIATNTGKKVNVSPINREAEAVEQAMNLLVAKNQMAHNVIKQFFLYGRDLSEIAWGYEMVYRKKQNGRVYGDSKWADRKLDKALNMLEDCMREMMAA